MRSLYSIVFLLLSLTPGYSQGYIVEAGISGRVPVFYARGLRGQISGPLINYTAPYSYKAGVTGTGVTIGYGYNITKKWGIKFLCATTIRYDFYEFTESGKVNTFYFDQSFFITKSVFSKCYIGVGYTFFSLGKVLRYTYVDKEMDLQLHFNSYDILFGFPVWKIYVEPKISIVQDDFPGNIKDNATLLGARVYYRFNFGKSN